MLLSRIRSIHQRSYGTYGAPRIHAELRASGIRAGRKRVARLMRMAAISGVSRRRAVRTTWRSEESKKAPDLVNRDFSAPVRDRLWVADITYVPTHAGFPLSLGGHRRLQPSRRRLVHGQPPAKRTGHRRPRHGPWNAQTPRGDPPQRPGIAVHLGGLRQKMQTGRGQTLNGFRSATATTTRCARASSPAWNANCSIAGALPPGPTPDSPCSNTSRASTTPGEDTLPLDTSHP